MCERRFVTMNCHLRNIFAKCPSYVCTKICIWSLGGKHRRVRAARRPPPYEYSALGHTPIYIRTPLCNAPFCFSLHSHVSTLPFFSLEQTQFALCTALVCCAMFCCSHHSPLLLSILCIPIRILCSALLNHTMPCFGSSKSFTPIASLLLSIIYTIWIPDNSIEEEKTLSCLDWLDCDHDHYMIMIV